MSFEDVKQYIRMVGKLIFLTITQHDICFVAKQVSHYIQTLKMYHWNIVDMIFKYLNGTPSQGICMRCIESSKSGYCDDD